MPLQVVIGATAYDEGVDAGGRHPQMLAEALKEWTPVSTSRPNPEAILEVYEKLAAEGADAIVSVHISAELSGTFESAQLAARRASVPVTPVDSRQVGHGHRLRRAGGGRRHRRRRRREVAAAAAARTGPPAPRRCSTSTRWSTSVVVAGWARRGRSGRLRARRQADPDASTTGGWVPFEKVRTVGQGAVAGSRSSPWKRRQDAEVDVAVAHLASPDRAAQLAERLADRLADRPGGRAGVARRDRCRARCPRRTRAWSPWRCRGAPERPHRRVQAELSTGRELGLPAPSAAS